MDHEAARLSPAAGVSRWPNDPEPLAHRPSLARGEKRAGGCMSARKRIYGLPPADVLPYHTRLICLVSNATTMSAKAG